MSGPAQRAIGGAALSRGKVGMGLFIGFEAIFFCTLVLTYLFYVGRSTSGPRPHEVLGLDLVIVNTICLLASSATIVLAVRSLRRGNVRAFGLWWAATMALGLEFIAGTGFEWYTLIEHDGLTLQTNLFGTTFYTLVGFHAGHVIVGLGMLSIVLGAALLGGVRQHDGERVEIVSLYWHFVDAVWVVVFTSVYLISRQA
jgi:cytochrome c oxidase subunit 3